MNLYRISIRSILIALIAIGGGNAFADDKGGKGGKGGWTSLQSEEMLFGARGGGTLLRSKDAVEARLSTMDLDPGAAYTVWWVIFNKPSECSDQVCGEDDVFENAMGPPLNSVGVDRAEISVIYAAGFVTGDDGVANVTAHLNAGKVPAGWGVNFGWKDGKYSGLKKGNGNKAEFHMVVRSHKAAVAGMVGFRTSNFDPGCDCEDQQVILFKPL